VSLLPLLRAAERPSVIYVSSGAGLRREKPVLPGTGSYSVSKHALEGLGNNFAFELKHDNIRVNVVNPGPTRTDMLEESGGAAHLTGIYVPTTDEITPIFLYHCRADVEVTNSRVNCHDWIGKDFTK